MIGIKKRIIVDFDGVVVNTVKAVTDLYNLDFRWYRPYKPVHWTEINTWDFEELNLASKEHINHYFETYRFFQKLEPMENAIEVLEELSHTYDIVICPMGYTKNLKYKEEWIHKNLPFVKEFIGVNLNDYKDKSHINMSGCVFVDDSYNNLINNNASISVCYGDIYSWNEKWQGKRCYNWTDFKKYLVEIGY